MTYLPAFSFSSKELSCFYLNDLLHHFSMSFASHKMGNPRLVRIYTPQKTEEGAIKRAYL